MNDNCLLLYFKIDRELSERFARVVEGEKQLKRHGIRIDFEGFINIFDRTCFNAYHFIKEGQYDSSSNRLGVVLSAACRTKVDFGGGGDASKQFKFCDVFKESDQDKH